MKKILTLLCLIPTIIISANCEEKTKTTVVNETVKNTEIRYTFEIYGGIEENKNADASHYLGKNIAYKWDTFIDNYTRSHSTAVGLSDASNEILKPEVFNSVNKLNRAMRKRIKSGEITMEQAQALMSHVLDCSNAIKYCGNTKEFENELSKAKNTEDIVNIFYAAKVVTL